MLLAPVVFETKDAVPKTELYEPVVLANPAFPPTAVFSAPVVFALSA